MRHGLYAKRLSKDELSLIGAFAIGDLKGEIALQRALIGRLAQILEHNGLAPGSTRPLPQDTRETLKLLNQIMRDLLRFVHADSLQTDDLHLYQSQIEAGKRLARKRRNVFDYLEPPAAS
jgi:hypothetical protein